jgi:hypothetical protein
MKVEELRQYLSQRTDGPWELLATAVGNASSLRTTLDGLRADQIELAGRGRSISPEIVDQRIQAVAAFDRHRVSELVLSWPSLRALMGADPMSVEVDFWTAAWVAALRFLPSVPELTALEIGSLPMPIQVELTTLGAVVRKISLDAVLIGMSRSDITYHDLRRLGRSVSAAVPVSEDFMRNLFAIRLGALGLERLRILSDMTDFEEGALEYLVTLFAQLDLQRTVPVPGPSGGELVLIELVLRHSASESRRVQLVDRLLAGLQTDGPRYWAPLAYLVSGTQWVCP